mgnify:CR=1 FL=1
MNHRDNKSKNESWKERVDWIYYLLNLLTRGLSFVDVLFTFGRYYADKYPFFVDFNVILGVDIR